MQGALHILDSAMGVMRQTELSLWCKLICTVKTIPFFHPLTSFKLTFVPCKSMEFFNCVIETILPVINVLTTGSLTRAFAIN